MKNRKRSALVTSFVMMLAALMALSTATFAWFTNANEANVEQFQFTANAASGFQISLVSHSGNTVSYDGWKSTITTGELRDKYPEQLGLAEGTNNLKGKMIPVSADVNNVADGKFYAATFKADGTATIAQAFPVDANETTPVAGYYAFEVGFWNQGNEEKEIVLNTGSTITEINSTKVLKDAARVGFVSAQGSNATTSAAVTTIWAVDATAANALNQVTADNAVAPVKDGFVVAPSTQGATNYVTATTPNTSVGTNGATVIKLAPDEQKVVKIYVWIEGQDEQCVNTNSGETVGVTLNFTVKETAASNS